MKTNTKLLNKFKKYIQAKNLSETTITVTIRWLKRFLDEVPEKNMKKLTKAMIEDYIVHKIKSKSYSIMTMRRLTYSIKKFFRFLEETNYIFINPAELIKLPKKPGCKITPALTEYEINKILKQPKLHLARGVRDRAILETFYSTGIRLEELCNLKIFDMNFTDMTLRVNRGKGNKDRTVPIGKHAIRFIKACMKTRILSNDYLFQGMRGDQIKKRQVSGLIRKYVRKAEVIKKVTAHVFRYTFATMLIKNGADIVSVQKMLGHVSIKTTQVYVRLLGFDVKNAHEKSHPREKTKEEVVETPNILRII